MISGRWYMSRTIHHLQHWKKPNAEECICGAQNSVMDDGSLLPFEGFALCPICLPVFQEAARQAIPEYEQFISALKRFL